jgi:hypothetical protein
LIKKEGGENQMVSLLDIAPGVEEVTLGARKVALHAISAKNLAELLKAAPAVRMMISGVKPEPDMLIAQAPDAVALAIVMAAHVPEEKRAEEAAHVATWSIDTQANALDAIWRVTFPNGSAPFVERLERMGLLQPATPAAASPGKAPVTKSPPQ